MRRSGVERDGTKCSRTKRNGRENNRVTHDGRTRKGTTRNRMNHNGMWLAALLVLAPLALAPSLAPAGDLEVAVEGGAAWQTRNDFRIPGDGGTLVKLTDFDSGPAPAFRATLRWDFTERQSLRLLVAPLSLETTFAPAEPVAFQDLVFPAGEPTDARYVFNSWRLTWYWRFASSGRWTFRFGATLKVRDAEIGLSGAPGTSVKDDLGLVPLVYAYARYQATDALAFEAEADALAAPQGRAEDVSIKAVLRVSERVSVDAGYRLLEGGADNDEVYTFAFFHYAVAGVRVRF
jgi:hypothetical protein